MKKYLNPNKEKLKSKAIDSVISRVMNLKEKNREFTHERFSEELENEFSRVWEIDHINKKCLDEQTSLDCPEILKIYEQLRNWNWVYG